MSADISKYLKEYKKITKEIYGFERESPFEIGLKDGYILLFVLKDYIIEGDSIEDMKKMFVTGASGLLGSNIITSAPKDFIKFGLDLNDKADFEDCKLYKVDLTQKSQLKIILSFVVGLNSTFFLLPNEERISFLDPVLTTKLSNLSEILFGHITQTRLQKIKFIAVIHFPT